MTIKSLANRVDRLRVPPSTNGDLSALTAALERLSHADLLRLRELLLHERERGRDVVAPFATRLTASCISPEQILTPPNR